MRSRAVRRLVLGLLPALALTCAADEERAGLRLPPLAPGSVRFYVVRHGEALSNLAHPPPDATAEDLDHLTSRGRAQAQDAGRALRAVPVDLIVTSPRMRARETALVIDDLLPGHVPRREDERLRNLHLGNDPGGRHLTWPEREKEWKSGRDPSPPGGESLAELARRVNDAFQGLARVGREGGPTNIVVVTHSEVVEGVLGLAEKRLPLHATMAGVRNASITVVDVDRSGSYRVVARDSVPGP